MRILKMLISYVKLDHAINYDNSNYCIRKVSCTEIGNCWIKQCHSGDYALSFVCHFSGSKSNWNWAATKTDTLVEEKKWC